MWEEHEEEGKIIWINESVGNVIKMKNSQFLAMVPRVVKLGPFDTVEEAKQVAEDKQGLDRVLDNYNLHLTNLSRSLKE